MVGVACGAKVPNYQVKLEGLSEMEEKIPNWIDHGERKLVDNIAHRLADSVHDASPKGGIPFRGRAVNSSSAEISSNHPGAKALDKGAYIRGKGKKLKFEVDGRTIFATAVRLAARNYTKKGLRKRNSIAKEEFSKIFDAGGFE